MSRRSAFAIRVEETVIECSAGSKPVIYPGGKSGDRTGAANERASTPGPRLAAKPPNPRAARTSPA
jgi:hypothetical protein